MAKSKKVAKKGKQISRSKLKNISNNKRSKQGNVSRGSKRKKPNQKSKNANQNSLNQSKQEDDPSEITGEEMLDMIAEEDLGTFGLIKNMPSLSKEVIGAKRGYGDVLLGSKKKLKQMLPVMTDDGWSDQRAIVSTEKPGIIMEKFKRAEKKHKHRRKNKEDAEKTPGVLQEASDTALESTVSDVDLSGLSVAQLMAYRERQLKNMKIHMASLATSVLEDSTKVSNLRRLIEMMNENGNLQADIMAKKYLMMTLMKVFHDLIPSYRLQENILDKRVSKEMLVVGKHELSILSYYRKYLQGLENVLNAMKESDDDFRLNALGETALYCLGDLLVLHPAFNYALNIVHFLVPFLNHKEQKFRTLALDPLVQTIKADTKYVVTVQIVKSVYDMIHRKRFKIKEEALRIFLALRVNEIKNADRATEEENSSTRELKTKDRMIRKLASKAAPKHSRKKKKELKKMAKIREEMSEINTKKLLTVQNTSHSEIVDMVFGIYFHILKQKSQSKLMPLVLEGLSRFSHLINIEFFSDLLAVLHELIDNGQLGRTESLFCIHTVFSILSGQGEALNIDAHRFYNTFYSILASMSLDEKEKNIAIIIRVVEKMLLLRRKKVSSTKVLSFIKRLSTLALTLPHPCSISTLVLVKKMFSVFPESEALLDPDQDGSPGLFSPEVLDPENANPMATALWELVLAKRHYHPSVRIMSANILSGGAIRDDRAAFSLFQRSTRNLLESYNTIKFNPAISAPSAWPKSKYKPIRSIVQDGEFDLENMTLHGLLNQHIDEPLALNSPSEESESLGEFYEDCLDCYRTRDSDHVVDEFNFVKEYIGPT